MNKLEKIRIFTDFDGTVTLKDLGDELFKEMGQFQPFSKQLQNREIDIKTYWYRLFETLPKSLSKKDIKEFTDNYQIDSYFLNFVDFCQDNNFPLKVVSDGYREYIDPILEREGIGHLEVWANKINFEESPFPIFPGASESCECFCASCKRNSVISLVPEDSIIVFIGDGYSDFCAAEHSDIIFAKKNLAKYCNENKLPHYPYNSFFDIISKLKYLIENNKFKVRNDAFMKRKRAVEAE